MIKTDWEIVIDSPSILGEGPVWDAEKQRIIWLDIHGKTIHSYYLDTKNHIQFQLDQLIGAVTLTETNKLLAALENGFYWINEETGDLERILDPEKHLPENRFNDAKCDPQGRFWAGTMHNPETKVTGNLYRLDPDYTVTHFLSDIGCSNGLAWNKAADTMYYIDSPTRQVVGFDFSEDGNISNKRVIYTIPEGEGFPDGMTIDENDNLWIGLWDGWKVICVGPDNGEKLHEIQMPVGRITSCTFGGPDLADLYLTSAKINLSDEQLQEQPLAGNLFVIKNIGVKGVLASKFKKYP